MRVLVTGAAGFIGSHVAEHCLRKGMQVVAVDNLSGGNRNNVPDGCIWREGDILSAEFVRGLWEQPFDVVYHLAAYAAEGLSHFIRHYNYEHNLLGSINLINEAINHEASRFVFTSSIAVYGENQLPMTEDLTPCPEDPYGISKYAVELDLHSALKNFGLEYTVFRPHNVYGERQNIADRYRNVIGIFMNQIMQDKPLTIFGDGEQTRAFSHVDDVAPVIAAAPLVPESVNEIFNIGADTPYSVNAIVREISNAFDCEPEVRYLPERNEVKHAFSGHGKVRGVFNTNVSVDLHEGINKMAEWVKANRRAVEPTEFTNIEVKRGLPAGW